MFMALDPSVFVDGFPTRLNGLMTDLRNLEPVSGLTRLWYKFYTYHLPTKLQVIQNCYLFNLWVLNLLHCD